MKILTYAQIDAMEILEKDPKLDKKENIFVEENEKQEKLRTYNKTKINRNVKKVLKKAKNIDKA